MNMIKEPSIKINATLVQKWLGNDKGRGRFSAIDENLLKAIAKVDLLKTI